MALLWFDGFNSGNSTEIVMSYDATSSTCNAGTSGARSGGGHVTPNGSSQYLKKTVTFSSTTAIVGIGVCNNLNATTASDREFLRIMEGTTTHLSLWIKGYPSYCIELRHGSGSVIATGTTPWPVGNTAADYRYVELKATISDSGTYEVRIEGVTEFSGSADTRNGGTGQPDLIHLTCSVSSYNLNLDDFYICDTSGADMNDFLGPGVRIDSLYANAAGDSAAWTPSAGANYTCVDETGANNGDTDYVSAASSALIDSYNCVDLSVTPSAIKAARAVVIARKDDVGTNTLKAKVRSGSTVSSETGKNLTTSYAAYNYSIVTTDPNTSAAWTKSGIDAVKIEIERTA